MEPAGVSIHALLAECDCFGKQDKGQDAGFNPRTPCGVRPNPETIKPLKEKFQSTHSLRSATPCCLYAGTPHRSFNPRTPCGVRLASSRKNVAISTFQSTHSLRSATPCREKYRQQGMVSIHALLAECDAVYSLVPSPVPRFNPRTPCGVRRGQPPKQ